MNDYFIINAGQFLDCFGPTQEEIEWTPSQKKAFKMSEAEADLRLQTIRKFFPNAYKTNQAFPLGRLQHT